LEKYLANSVCYLSYFIIQKISKQQQLSNLITKVGIMKKYGLKEINNNIVVCLLYVSSLIWIFPASNFILPLIIWLLTKHRGLLVEAHGRNLLNFQLSWFFMGVVIWTILSLLSCSSYFSCIFGLIPTHILVFGLIGFFIYCLIIAAAVSAYHGEFFELPLSYSFFR
jgi:uncharacterized Tic20 family protein